MATQNQRAAARKNIKKAAKPAKRNRTLKHLPKKTPSARPTGRESQTITTLSVKSETSPERLINVFLSSDAVAFATNNKSFDPLVVIPRYREISLYLRCFKLVNSSSSVISTNGRNLPPSQSRRAARFQNIQEN